uniref:YozE SAM-like domain-containing protein n=1 Tax=viral metagenome TaxID=1070528 RepID=A0A6H1ZRA5_9ZZZZ
MIDFTDWIYNKMEEKAKEDYGKDYTSLPDKLQELVYFKAQAEYKDYCADILDHIFESKEEG